MVYNHPGEEVGMMGTCTHAAPTLALFPSPSSPRVSRLASEKQELEAQLGRSREEALAGRAARQEAEALRGLVHSLELELRQERSLGHRGARRRSQDCRRLVKEVRRRGGWRGLPAGRGPWPQSMDLCTPIPSRQLEEVKASERSLRARLKTLNSELATYKRG